MDNGREDSQPIRPLRLPPELRTELLQRAARAHPEEACGLLVGHERRDAVVVVRVDTAANLEHSRRRDRYTLDPRDFIRIERAARGDGLEVVGVWHSHPDAPARPSRRDLEGAWEGYSYVIVGAGDEGGDRLRSWRLAGGRFREQTLLA